MCFIVLKEEASLYHFLNVQIDKQQVLVPHFVFRIYFMISEEENFKKSVLQVLGIEWLKSGKTLY